MPRTTQPDDDPFHAIADANRRKLLDLLRDRERCVQDLVPHLGITIGAVSQHLKVLHRSGLVSWRKDGRYRYYRADATALKVVNDWVERYRKHWEHSLDKLAVHLNRQA